MIVTLADVASRVQTVTPGTWVTEPVPGIPENTNAVIVDTDDLGDEIFLDFSGFTTPSRLLHGPVEGPLEQIKSAPSFFDADDITVSQFFATSKDGTAIPYFVVGQRDDRRTRARRCSAATADSRCRARRDTTACWVGSGWPAAAPTSWPTSAAAVSTDPAGIPRRCGKAATWSQRTSPRSQRIWCVAEVTTVEQLGAQGGSNGGLLMGIMLTRYPELFGALVCSVPLLDMRRFHLLLAGASWVAEYGDPDDPDDWEFISEYSPYQNISADRRYPPLLMTTSTRDDRVHPGHARKMTAALEAAGHHVRYYENIEGGHAGAADNAQTAFRSALVFEFLHRTLTEQAHQGSGLRR